MTQDLADDNFLCSSAYERESLCGKLCWNWQKSISENAELKSVSTERLNQAYFRKNTTFLMKNVILWKQWLTLVQKNYADKIFAKFHIQE